MAQHVGDGFDRRVVGQGADGPGVAQCPGADTGPCNPGFLHVSAHDVGDHQAVQRSDRRLHGEEDLPERGVVAAVPEVMDERFAHRVQERQHHLLAALLSTDADTSIPPVNIVQKQLCDGYTTQAVSHHQYHDGVVSGVVGRILINLSQHPFQSRVLHPLGQGSIPIAPDWRNQARKIHTRVLVSSAVAEKPAERATQGSEVFRAVFEMPMQVTLDRLRSQLL